MYYDIKRLLLNDLQYIAYMGKNKYKCYIIFNVR